MDRIYKKICLDRSRSHTQGLLPFIEFNGDGTKMIEVTSAMTDGNWGGFVSDIDSAHTYCDMIDRYYSIQKQLRNGIKLKKIKRGEKCQCGEKGVVWTENYNDVKDLFDYALLNKSEFYQKSEVYYQLSGECEDNFIILVDDKEKIGQEIKYLNSGNTSWSGYCKTVEEYLGKFKIPQEYVDLGDKVPSVMYKADVGDYVRWMDDNKKSSDCCIKKLWERRGGSAFTEYLKTIKWEGKTGNTIPVITLPILLTQNITDNGAYTIYDGAVSGNTIGSGSSRDILSEPYKMEYNRYSGQTIEMPSMLQSLRIEPYYYDDDRVLIDGLFKEFSGNGGYFKCIYYEKKPEKPIKILYVDFKYSGGSIVSGTAFDEEEEIEECKQKETPPYPSSNNAYQIVGLNGKGEIKLTSGETKDERYKVGASYCGGTIYYSYYEEYEITNTYTWFELEKCSDPQSLLSGDDLQSSMCKGSSYYRVLRLAEMIPQAVFDDTYTEKTAKDGDTFYYLLMYDNGIVDPQNPGERCEMTLDYEGTSKTTDIPFKNYTSTGENIFNLTFLDDSGNTAKGDFVKEITLSGDKITITYIIGGEFKVSNSTDYEYKKGTGDVYKETHAYRYPINYYTMDGYENIPVYCKSIDFDSDKKVGYSSRTGLSALTNTSILTEYTTGEIWKEKSAYTENIIYKEDYLLGVSEEPEEKINVSYENGTAAVWEKHFKLGECNTFDDLKKYGNNYFSIED